MSTPHGLTSAEAAARLARHGPNALPPAPPDPLWRRLGRQLRSPLIYVLLVAVLVDVAAWAYAGALGVPVEALVITVILVLNAGLGVWQERRAERALAELGRLAAPQVWVLRDGGLVRRPAEELVPGDVVRVEAGDRVPADGTLPPEAALLVDESMLTGESLPVDRAAGDTLAAGALVVRGMASLTVTATGTASAMGRLATLLADVHPEPTPLERRLDVFGRRVARWVLALAATLAAAGLAIAGPAHFGTIFLFAVALAVAAVPEGLPAVLTVTLALGVQRMARRHAVVRRLAAVEALGSVTVIATDKTGTLTENRMRVAALDVADAPRAVRAMVVANDAEPGGAAGDPIDVALLAHAAEAGCDVAAVRRAFVRRSARAFDAAWKFARVTGDEAGRVVTYVKGAPEEVLARCTLDEAARADWHARVQRHAAEGYRLLGLGWAEGEREDGLEWLGLVALWDPPRAEVPDAIARARAAGIRVVMVTGDHPATAGAVAAMIGIPAARVVDGAALAAASPERLRQIVREADVFARVAPEHKLRLVEALAADGEIVAMTGDGVNDAPALKRAAVGVAMGQRGSDVSREVADLVLLDDDFATIVAAIEEGRSIHENVQKFIRFLFSTNLSEVIVVGVGMLVALALGLRDATGELLLPLTAAQLLWINLVTDGAPAVALGLDRNPGVLARPPLDPRAPLLDARSLRFVVLSGLAKAAIAFLLLALLPRLAAASGEETRTAVFLFMAAGQLVFAYPARHTELWPPTNRTLHAAVGVSLAIQIAVVATPGLRGIFDGVPLGPLGWTAVLVAIGIAWGCAELLSRTIWSGAAAARPPARLDRPAERRLEGSGCTTGAS